MKFNIKNCLWLSAFILISNLANAQSISENVEQDSIYLDVGGFQIGRLFPIGINKTNNYNAGLEYSSGMEFNYFTNFKRSNNFMKHVILGVGYNYVKASVEDVTKIGNYEKTLASNLRFFTGYGFSVSNKFDGNVQLSIGMISYRNFHSDDVFYDRGVNFSITPQLHFTIYKWFGMYVSSEFRYAHLDVEAPSLGGINFNNSFMMIPSVGIEIP